MARDDFSEPVKKILAMRVSYRCSNPECRRVTIGPSAEPNKAASIGVAAHITAASPSGPRYNASLAPEVRMDAANGIWLCQSCSRLIDVDPLYYTTGIIIEWKIRAEEGARVAFHTGNPSGPLGRVPFLEAELVFSRSFSSNQGFLDDGKPLGAIRKLEEAVMLVEKEHSYILRVYNSSDVSAFGIKIHKSDVSNNMLLVDKLPNISNLGRLDKIEVPCKLKRFMIGTAVERRVFDVRKFPKELEGMKLLIEYRGDTSGPYFTEFVVVDEEQQDNRRLLSRPDYYDTVGNLQ